jgi:hypothetical protein
MVNPVFGFVGALFNDLCHIAVLGGHLLCVNLSSAGPLVCVWLEWRSGRRDDALAGDLGKRLARDVVLSLAVGSLLGLALAGIMWLTGESRFLEAIAAFSQRIWWGWWELLFSAICLVAYYYTWPSTRTSLPRALGHRFVALVAATNLLYHFPPLFTVISEFDPSTSAVREVSSAEFRAYMLSPHVISITIHVWIASVATVGIWLMWKGCQSRQSPLAWPMKAGARIALAASVLQLPVGIWVLLQLPAIPQDTVMGGDWLSTGLLVMSLFSTVGLLHQLAPAALGEVHSKSARSAIVNFVLLVVLMSATLWRTQRF